MGALAFVGTPTMQLSDIQASQDVEATVVFATSLAIPADGEIVVVFPANFALTNFAGTDPYPCDKTFSDPTATLLLRPIAVRTRLTAAPHTSHGNAHTDGHMYGVARDAMGLDA